MQGQMNFFFVFMYIAKLQCLDFIKEQPLSFRVKVITYVSQLALKMPFLFYKSTHHKEKENSHAPEDCPSVSL
jgi:flagellar biosynthesis protein FliQ